MIMRQKPYSTYCTCPVLWDVLSCSSVGLRSLLVSLLEAAEGPSERGDKPSSSTWCDLLLWAFVKYTDTACEGLKISTTNDLIVGATKQQRTGCQWAVAWSWDATEAVIFPPLSFYLWMTQFVHCMALKLFSWLSLQLLFVLHQVYLTEWNTSFRPCMAAVQSPGPSHQNTEFTSSQWLYLSNKWTWQNMEVWLPEFGLWFWLVTGLGKY